MPSFDERVPFGSFGQIGNKGIAITRESITW